MTKERLREYRAIKLERDKLQQDIEELEAVMYGASSSKLSNMPRSGNNGSSSVENHALRHDELLRRYKQKEAELSAALLEIENAIETLPPRERTLVRLYYAKGLTWEAVAVEMGYCWRQVHRIHSDALEALKAKEQTKTCD